VRRVAPTADLHQDGRAARHGIPPGRRRTAGREATA
jgi:hypothetical protein